MIKVKSYRASLKDEKYSGLYDLAKKGQIQTKAFSANVKNHNHRSTKRHWNKIKQYCKVILDTLWEVIMIGLAVNYLNQTIIQIIQL